MNPRALLLAATLVLVAAGGLGAWYALVADAVEADAPSAAPLPLPPVPPRITAGLEYDRCLGLLTTDPDGAAVLARIWVERGGGEGATHCLALSRIALGEPELGAAQLEKLASDSASPPVTRASLLYQAAQAWLMAGETARAHGAASMALLLSPDNADLLIERAIAAGGLERFGEVVDDLSRALAIDARRADALVLRGAALRHLDRQDEARTDIETALVLDPENAEALLERGILRQRRNDQAGARSDWQRAIALAPDSAAADLARQNLDLLEAGPSR